MAKELSKVPQIKKYIELDPKNPGVVSAQRYVNKEGKKSKTYYLWQSSILGEKISIRIPKEDVGKVKQVISAAKATAKASEKRTISVMKSYREGLSNLIERNRKIRARNADAETKAEAEKRSKEAKSEIKKMDKIIKKVQSGK